jgi:hypothetical protein
MVRARVLSLLFPIVVLPALAGCGGVDIVLKSPVEQKCGSAGLKGCPEMTEGVLLYVKGEEEQGKVKIEKGAAENAPAKVKKFAKMIKQLKKIPGTEKYTAKIVAVADILSASAAKGGAGGPGAPGDSGGAGGALDEEDSDAIVR